MNNFFKNVFSSFIGALVALALFFAFLFIIAIGIFYMASKSEKVAIEVAENSVLEIKLNAAIHEESSENPFGGLDIPVEVEEDAIGLVDLVGGIKKAAKDPKIKGIYLHVTNPQASFASLEEIRKQLLDFKKTGKFIVAYAHYMSEKALYLSTIADERYVNPSGLLELNGLSVERYYLKNMLAKLGVEPLIFRVGKFKSAVEPLMRENMSDASRLQTKAFIGSIFDTYTSDMANDLGKTKEEVREIADQLLIRKPQDAVENGVITAAIYEDEVEAILKDKTGTLEDTELELVRFSSYKESFDKGEKKTKIAVIVAEGEIVMGHSDGHDKIGVDLAKTIKKVRNDKNIKAVVLRINSPGGSSLTSDIIWREIVKLKEEKPVIASMSDMAASGGYFLAMPCDSIIAYPTTITGSIGVFGILMNLQKLTEGKLGVTFDRVNTSKFADIGSPNRKMTDLEKDIIQEEVNRIYDDFTSKAAEGRGMTQDAIKKIAGGRVWSGKQAIEIGLVDKLGGFEDAINMAAELGEVTDYSLEYFPKHKNVVEQLLEGGYESFSNKIIEKQLGPLAKPAQLAKRMQTWDMIQARIPYEVEIH
ncbi:MAG: signal peptide peptidase SppA [Cyclobacteriaceae bacterium]